MYSEKINELRNRLEITEREIEKWDKKQHETGLTVYEDHLFLKAIFRCMDIEKQLKETLSLEAKHQRRNKENE